MSTRVQAVINAAADEADSLLEGIATPTEAKPLLAEWLADHHPDLPPPERQQVVAEVIAVLEREGFFAVGAGGDSLSDSSDTGVPDE